MPGDDQDQTNDVRKQKTEKKCSSRLSEALGGEREGKCES